MICLAHMPPGTIVHASIGKSHETTTFAAWFGWVDFGRNGMFLAGATTRDPAELRVQLLPVHDNDNVR